MNYRVSLIKGGERAALKDLQFYTAAHLMNVIKISNLVGDCMMGRSSWWAVGYCDTIEQYAKVHS